jgi:hypothetical protein
MLIHPTVERLRALGLTAMADAFIEMHNTPEAAELTREDWLGLLVDREATSRENKRLARRLRDARLRQAAVVEDVSACASRPRPRPVPQARHLRVGARSSPSRRCWSMGGLVDAVSTPLMPPMRFAGGGMVPEVAAVGGGGSPIYFTFPGGATVGPMMADRQVAQAMRREGRRAAMLSAGKLPSTA